MTSNVFLFDVMLLHMS